MNLKKCPFCGGNVKMIERKLYQVTYYHVVCESCSAMIGALDEDKQEAEERWNRRVED